MGTQKIPIEVINERKPAQCLLTAVEYLKDSHVSLSGSKRSRIKCICKCGKEKTCIVADLIRGNPLSCGCTKKGKHFKESIGDKYLYRKWYDMRERCYNPNCKNYKNYGLVGIVVCEEWKNNYDNFAKWSVENGYSRELQLDKDIKSPVKPGKIYSPETCSWVTPLENMSNRGNSIKYLFKGELLTIPEISRKTGVLQSVLKAGVKAKKSIDDIIYPTQKRNFKLY